MFVLVWPFAPFVPVVSILLSTSCLLSVPLVEVTGFAPNENEDGTVVADDPLLGFPNTNPCPAVDFGTPFSEPLVGLLRNEKLFPPDGADLNPPNPEKTLGAPS